MLCALRPQPKCVPCPCTAITREDLLQNLMVTVKALDEQNELRDKAGPGAVWLSAAEALRTAADLVQHTPATLRNEFWVRLLGKGMSLACGMAWHGLHYLNNTG